MGKPILLKHRLAPGDITCMTACVRDLALQYPGKFDIHIYSSCKTLWNHNPHIVTAKDKPTDGMPMYKLNYGRYMSGSNREPMHFLTAFHQDLGPKLGLKLPVVYPHGDLHLSEEQKANSPVEGRYWYIIAGGKKDFTCKVWSYGRWQQLINVLRQYGIGFVQGGALHQGHFQPPLSGCLNLVNKTTLRDMMWLIYHADGVICYVTAAMHIAAALEKPCVVIAGGREHWWWEAYVNTHEQTFGSYAKPVRVPHRFLHTQTLLPCCKERGCWKNKVLTTEQDKHRLYCKKPVDDGYGRKYPKCMDLITVEHVADAVLSYYDEGVMTL
jgi:ADP-heptose:LPS heptosyltransferase